MCVSAVCEAGKSRSAVAETAFDDVHGKLLRCLPDDWTGQYHFI